MKKIALSRIGGFSDVLGSNLGATIRDVDEGLDAGHDEGETEW